MVKFIANFVITVIQSFKWRKMPKCIKVRNEGEDCPKCGSKEVNFITYPDSENKLRKFKCRKCGYKWFLP